MIAIDDTSITQAASLDRPCAQERCRSVASGVVSPAGFSPPADAALDRADQAARPRRGVEMAASSIASSSCRSCRDADASSRRSAARRAVREQRHALASVRADDLRNGNVAS